MYGELILMHMDMSHLFRNSMKEIIYLHNPLINILYINDKVFSRFCFLEISYFDIKLSIVSHGRYI